MAGRALHAVNAEDSGLRRSGSANPASWKKAVKRGAGRTGGWVEQVSEAEIALAKAQIGAEGIGCEPASAVDAGGVEEAGVGGEGAAGGSVCADPDRAIR